MVGWLISNGPLYSAYSLEIGLCALLLWRGQWRRLASVWLYVLVLLAIDGLARPYVIYRYGLASEFYAYFFWMSDVLLALAAFAVVCAFFRRACVHEARMWRFLRVLLVFVFILVLGISYLSLSRNYTQLITRFIIEFEQNLYFTCLVLNTLLYILMQQIESADDELGLLVCGMGIQFAGPTASLALVHLTPGQQYAEWLLRVISPLCTLGMLLTWLYAVTRIPKAARVAAVGGEISDAAEVPLPGA